MRRRKPIDLKEACVTEALAVIEEAGLESLSIRDIARRLGVSHQAPYKHFPSSEHLLAELVRRSYVEFAEHLEARPRGNWPGEDMGCMGEAYFQFAMDHPLKYRLLFGTPLPDPEEHPAMMQEARRAFMVLLEGVARMKGGGGSGGGDLREHHLDAIFVWSVVHGMATIMQSAALHQLGLDEVTVRAAMPHALESIGKALSAGGVSPQVASNARGRVRKPVRRRASSS